MRYVTNFILFLIAIQASGQLTDTTATDSIKHPNTYGLRIGIDLASLARTAIDNEYTGVQLLADYRIKPNLYLAAELGNESIDRTTDRIDFKTNGSYIKAGIDYNLYKNWLDMDNMIYIGGRLGAANFNQNLLRYDYHLDNDYFTAGSNNVDREFNGLNAIWIELQLGLKVEVLNNLYLIGNVQLKNRLTQQTPPNFNNLYIPGFGRTYDTSTIGVGYSYGIMYRIPLYSK